MPAFDGPSPVAEPLLSEAVDWLDRVQSDRATTEDVAALTRWRARSPAHETAFREIVRLRHTVRALGISKPHLVPPRAVARPAMGRRAFLGAGTAIAAAMAGAIVYPPLGLWPSLSDLMADHHTGTGERFAFSPGAGVQVEMNTRTSLSLGRNSLRLLQGESFISVAARSPDFTVDAGPVNVRGRGTAFNIRSFEDTVCLSCINGAVRAQAAGRSIILSQGQEAYFGGTGTLVRRDDDVASTTAWRRGLLVFNGTPLPEVVAQLNRYLPGRIIITSSDLQAKTVVGVFRISRMDYAVTQIQEAVGAHVTRLGKLTFLS